jgi:DNA-binding NtrC family response regulator
MINQSVRDERTAEGLARVGLSGSGSSHDLPDPSPATILLVDDDSSVRDGLRRVLETENWKIATATSGEEALEYLQAHEPDLMITDLSMTGVNGWDLLFHENFQRPDLPIFVITALPLSVIGGVEKFAHEFFQKPIDLDALIAAVRRYIGVSRSEETS